MSAPTKPAAGFMALEDLLSHYVSEAILPAGAIGLATGLVRGAKALEKDANPQALTYVSDLLTKGDLQNIGKAGASLVPVVFNKVFGSKPFSFRFISRSVIATTLFWLLLLLLRHASWITLIEDVARFWNFYIFLIPLWYIVDYLSLLKAKFLITVILQKYAVVTSIAFLLVDVSLSYALSYLVRIIVQATNMLYFNDVYGTFFVLGLKLTTNEFLEFRAITDYFTVSSDNVTLTAVIVPSTLLTSVWTFLLFVSCLIAQLLVPIDYLRRFTSFWFKNVEKRPLTAIAKVAATLIVVGAMAIKAVRWVY
jgi:hypothetical protein